MGKKRKLEPYPKLGAYEFESKKKLAYIPKWIENSTSVSCDIQNEKIDLDLFSDYLSPWILDRLKKRGFSHLFPVQKLLIPEILDPFQNSISAALPPRDICVSAPTGSGKTLAYVLPVLEVLKKSDWNSSRHAIRVLVILPVVDLAKQVYEVFRSFLDDGKEFWIYLVF